MDLLTSDQKNELIANKILKEHLDDKIEYYVAIATIVRYSVPVEFTELDRVDFVAVWISKSDTDIIGLAARANISVHDVCESGGQ